MPMKVYSSPQEEAGEVFRRVVTDLSSSPHNLESVLHACLHACRILGWDDEIAWLQKELDGYPLGEPLPPYRCGVAATHEWRPVEDIVTFGRPPSRQALIDIGSGIAELEQANAVGWVKVTGETATFRMDIGESYDVYAQYSVPKGKLLPVL